jgi:hypothetical protein
MTYRGKSASTELYVDPSGPFVHSQFACQLERELNAANERIKRLEEAGDAMAQEYRGKLGFDNYDELLLNRWTAAKEDKL